MEQQSFSHSLTIHARNIQQSAYAILHLICFHRMLGTFRPGVLDVYGVQVPAISDPRIDALLHSRASELATLLKTTPTPRQVVLEVQFSLPSNERSSSIGDIGSREPAKQPAIGVGTGGIANTAVNAASSLRAWASPRNYQYGWLASAFSGGAGQAAHPYTSPPTSYAQQQERDAEVFETWTISFLTPARQDGEKSALAGTQAAITQIRDRILAWVGEHTSHLPPISSAALTPYPLRIFVRAVQ